MTEEPGTRRMMPPVDPADVAPPPSAEDVKPPPGAAMLVVDRGPQRGQQIKLSRARVEIGRSPECDIVLEDVTVSRKHAEISHESYQYVVRDSGSLNGTYLNRSPVDREEVLSDGDELRIGIFRLIFRA